MTGFFLALAIVLSVYAGPMCAKMLTDCIRWRDRWGAIWCASILTIWAGAWLGYAAMKGLLS